MSKASKRERQRENRERRREIEISMQKRSQRLRTLRNVAIVAVPIIVLVVVLQLNNSSGGSSKKPVAAATVTCTKSKPPAAKPQSYKQAPPMTIDKSKTYTATIQTSCGTITTQLDAATAPVATNNFVFLAQQGFYGGLKWHRAAKDFVIQGGDPKGDGSGGPGYSVQGEVPTNHYPIGALAAAKSQAEPAGTMGSQFFIVTGKNGATLPNDYALFGTVTDGIKVAQKIASFAPTSGDGQPTQPAYIFKITVKAAAPTATTAPATTTTKKK